jgi:hypothetical protein
MQACMSRPPPFFLCLLLPHDSPIVRFFDDVDDLIQVKLELVWLHADILEEGNVFLGACECGADVV